MVKIPGSVGWSSSPVTQMNRGTSSSFLSFHRLILEIDDDLFHGNSRERNFQRQDVVIYLPVEPGF